jgi:hypothetical protein
VFVLTVTYAGGRTRQISVHRERVAEGHHWLSNYQELKEAIDATFLPLLPSRCLHVSAQASSRSQLADAQLGMLTALQWIDEHDLPGRIVDIDDDLGNKCPHQSLARPHRGGAGWRRGYR